MAAPPGTSRGGNPGQLRPNTAAAPPVVLSGESVQAFSSNPRARRWPPQAPPHCAAWHAQRRRARHRWRRCPANAAPPPKPSGLGGTYGPLPGFGAPRHPGRIRRNLKPNPNQPKKPQRPYTPPGSICLPGSDSFPKAFITTPPQTIFKSPIVAKGFSG